MQYSHKKDKINFPAYIQPKLDGVRSLFGYFNNELRFISRRCLEFPNKLKHIKADFLKSNLPNSKEYFLTEKSIFIVPSLKHPILMESLIQLQIQKHGMKKIKTYTISYI